MTKLKLCFVLFAAGVIGHVVCIREKCEKCVPKEMCDMFGEMSKVEQNEWIESHPCQMPGEENDGTGVFGFAATAKGDLVCCPYSNVWGVENPSKTNKKENTVSSRNRFQSNDEGGYEYKQDDLHKAQNSNEDIKSDERDSKDDKFDSKDDDYDESNSDEVDLDKHRNWGINRRPPNRYYGGRQNGNRNNGINGGRNQPIVQEGFNRVNPGQSQFNRPQFPTYNQNPQVNQVNPPFNSGRNFATQNRPININNQVPSGSTNNFGNQNGFLPQQNPQVQQNQRCSISILPPNPQSGCCGLDLASERSFGAQNNFMVRPRPSQSNLWNNQPRFRRRYSRATNDSEDIGISLDNRIAGGKETDLYQFPWTVLLKSTFDYGDRQGTFNCGGSLISSRYVLTAAHCLKEDNAVLNGVEVYIAEFDKRTFPRDCVNSPEGRKCIDNILTQAESVVVHPEYDDNKLANDIALIRLRENVPYTDFIRPICLPPINIDNPDYSNLRLAVAGWGRNGSVPSEVKQSTVVNLVPQRECLLSYPQLSEKHVCAAGRSGEDTCKGDSGGPLMMLYQGQYYVSGVVSGKRRDAPCGTAVPSLYTNVYHFVPWISQSLKI